MSDNKNWETIVNAAVNNGRSGCSCSEAVAYTFAKHIGGDCNLFLKMASGFAGGMGLMGETCGVIGAGMLIIGMQCGPCDIEDSQGRRRSLMLCSEFSERFAQANGSTLCQSLCHGADLRSPEGARALRESGRPEHLIRSGAEILVALLAHEEWMKNA